MSLKSNNLNQREQWSSRMGFIWATAGLSVGLGNIWRFPYLVGEYGGGAFLVAYLIILFAATIPAMLLELGISKRTRQGNIGTYIEGTGSKSAGTFFGIFCSVTIFAVNMFYLTVVGYSVYYIYASIAGLYYGVDTAEFFYNFEANKQLMLIVFAIVCASVTVVVYKGVNKGIERISKILMPAIIIIFLILAARVAFLPNVIAGYNFLLEPDFSVLGTTDIWIAATGQVLFSVGLGPGVFIVYGSRLRKKEDIVTAGASIAMLDVAVAMLAAFVLIPATISFGMDPASGAPLLFIIIPKILSTIAGGQIFGLLLFTAVFFAGLTSAIGNLEVAVTTFMDQYGWRRDKTVIGLTIITILGAIPCLYSATFLEIVSNWICNYGYTSTALFSLLVFGWKYGVKKIREEDINPTSQLIKLGASYDFLIKYVSTPMMIYIVGSMIIGIITG